MQRLTHGIGPVLAAMLLAAGVLVAGCSKPQPKSGYRLVYDTGGAASDAASIATVLHMRLLTAGLKEHGVKPSGPGRVEILLPKGERAAVEQVKKLAGCRGLLELRICANPEDTPNYEKLGADHQKGAPPPSEYEWLPLRWDCATQWMDVVDFLWGTMSSTTRDQALTRYDANRAVLSMVRSSATPATDGGRVDILVLRHTPKVEGADFSAAAKASSPGDGAPAITFSIRADAQGRLGQLTGSHTGKRLAFVLDGKIWSAPVIRSALRTGAIMTGFKNADERDFLYAVLQSGTLPAALKLVEEGPPS